MNGDILRGATDRTVDKLLASVGRDGGIHRPCASRAIESALTLHLLRDLPRHREQTARLRSFCAGFWASARGPRADALLHPLAGMDRALSCALVAAVLDRPERAAVANELRGELAGFFHPTRNRKARLFAILLAEIDPTYASAGARSPALDDPAPSDQTWARWLILAAHIIDASRAGGSAVRQEFAAELARGQLDEGSWEKHILLTVTALIALEKLGRYPEAVDRGIGFLMREMRTDGGIPFVPDVDIWLTALTGLAINDLPDRRCDVDRMAAYVARHQLPSGGWAFTPGITTADADDTGLCTSFLERRHAAKYAENVARGRRALLGFRNPDGGFTTYVAGAGSEAEITARAILVLASDAVRYAPELDAAVRWLDAAQADDGTFRIEWTLCPTFPLAQVLSAIASLPGGFEQAARLRDRSVRRLAATQNADGGWGLAPGSPSRVLPTAYALAGLCRAAGADDRQRAGIVAASEFLVAQQLPDGGFASPPDALGPRPLIFDMDLFPTVYALHGLLAAETALGLGRRRRASVAASQDRLNAVNDGANDA